MAQKVIHPKQGHSIVIGGFGTTYKVMGADTNNSVAVIEHTLEPGLLAAPLHRHTHEDEISYVLEGEVTVQQGDAVATATAGSYIVKPRGVFHTFWNSGMTTLHLIEIVSPGGFEKYFEELALLMPQDAPPEMDAIVALAQRYGLEFDMESLLGLMEKHGVRLG